MHRFPTPNPPLLKVEFGAGSIRIETADVDETTVELTPSRADDRAAEELIARTAIEQRGDAIVVLVPRRAGRSTELSLSITAPTGAQLDIGAGSADVLAEGTYGTTSIDAGSGNVTVDHVLESARVRAGSGDIRLQGIDGDCDVKAGSGDVHVGDGGAAIRLKSGSGDVEIDHAATEIDTTTGSGDVAVGHITRGDVRVRTGSGDIRTSVDEGTAAWLDVRTISGRVHSDLASTDAPGHDDQRVRLRLHTASGDIDVVRA